MTTGLRELGTFLWSGEWRSLLRRRRSRPSSKSRKHYHLVPVCLSILRRFRTSQDLIISVGGKKTNVNVISFTYAKTTPKINVSSCPNQLHDFILFWTVCKCGVGWGMCTWAQCPKRPEASDPLWAEQEFQTVVNHLTWVLGTDSLFFQKSPRWA